MQVALPHNACMHACGTDGTKNQWLVAGSAVLVLVLVLVLVHTSAHTYDV